MRSPIHVLSPLTISLFTAQLAAAQPLPGAPEQPNAPRAAPAATDKVEDLTQTTLASPAAPAPTTTPQTPAGAVPQAPAPARLPATSSPMPMPNPQPVLMSQPDANGSVDIGSDRTRQGFYMRILDGVGFMSAAGTGPNGNSSVSGLGSSSVIGLGGSIRPGLVLGGALLASDVTAKFKGGPFGDATVTTQDKTKTFPATSKATVGTAGIGLLLDWYPAVTTGWHTGLTVGVGFTSLQNLADESAMVGTSAMGGLFGGYDWSLGKNWSLGLNLLVLGTTSANMKDSKDASSTGYSLHSFSAGLGASVLYF